MSSLYLVDSKMPRFGKSYILYDNMSTFLKLPILGGYFLAVRKTIGAMMLPFGCTLVVNEIHPSIQVTIDFHLGIDANSGP